MAAQIVLRTAAAASARAGSLVLVVMVISYLSTKGGNRASAAPQLSPFAAYGAATFDDDAMRQVHFAWLAVP
jgi:hypothetical protein